MIYHGQQTCQKYAVRICNNQHAVDIIINDKISYFFFELLLELQIRVVGDTENSPSNQTEIVSTTFARMESKMEDLFAKLTEKIDKSSKETQKDIQFLMAAVEEGKKERIAIAERLLSSTSVNRSTGLRPELAQNITRSMLNKIMLQS